MSENPEIESSTEPVMEQIVATVNTVSEAQPDRVINNEKPANSVPGQRPESVTLIAVYQFISALPGLIIALAILVIALPAVLYAGLDRISLSAALFGLALAILFTGGLGILSVFAGFGMLKMKEWARWITIVLAIFNLPVIPIGTLISVFILFYLFKPETRQMFLDH
jgi:membrane-associated protease RseP (regulator of RpoE activity)